MPIGIHLCLITGWIPQPKVPLCIHQLGVTMATPGEFHLFRRSQSAIHVTKVSPYPYSFLIYTPIPLSIYISVPLSPRYILLSPYPLILLSISLSHISYPPPIHPLLFISAHHLFSLLIYLHSLPMLLSPVTYPYPPSPITSISYHLG